MRWENLPTALSKPTQILGCSLFIKIHFNIFIPPKARSTKLSPSFMFPDCNTESIFRFLITKEANTTDNKRLCNLANGTSSGTVTSSSLCVDCAHIVQTAHINDYQEMQQCPRLHRFIHNSMLNICPFCRNTLPPQAHLRVLNSVKITYPKWMINSETEHPPHPTRNLTKASSGGGGEAYWSVKNQTPSEIRSSSLTDSVEASPTLYRWFHLQCITAMHIWRNTYQSEGNAIDIRFETTKVFWSECRLNECLIRLLQETFLTILWQLTTNMSTCSTAQLTHYYGNTSRSVISASTVR